MAVPLRVGGGSRLKILEALACGLPVVSTRVGAEGLELVPGRDYIAADEPEAMTRRLVACLRDPAPAQAMAEHCRPFVLDRYDWGSVGDQTRKGLAGMCQSVEPNPVEESAQMIIAALRSSSFVGGPERQMLGLAQHLSAPTRLIFLAFSEGGRAQAVLNRIRERGFVGIELQRKIPRFGAVVQEVSAQLRRNSANVLCCYGYKADLVGLAAARQVGIPVVAVSQGWTAATARVRLYETLDRICLRWMDKVVCVSHGQAVKVHRAGVRTDRIVVIHDAVQVARFDHPDPAYRCRMVEMFPQPLSTIVGSAGRLSPEKGFAVLVEAAAIVTRSDPGVGFVHFGDGPLRATIERQIRDLGLQGRFILAGFRDDLDRFLPHWDLSVLPSYTEGLPNVVLESYAAGVPVVATAVGGTPEAVADGVDGYLVPSGDPVALAGRILDVLKSGEARKAMGQRGRDRIQSRFTFEAQALRYQDLFDEITNQRPATPEAQTTFGPQQAATQ